jgi:hypothetical protein
MFKLFSSKNPVFKFSTKAFDVAVIGGGPGGNTFLIQVMLQPLKLLNLDSTQSVLKKEEALEEHV